MRCSIDAIMIWSQSDDAMHKACRISADRSDAIESDTSTATDYGDQFVKCSSFFEIVGIFSLKL